MSFKQAFKNFSDGMGSEIRQAHSLLRRLSLSETSTLGANFRKYGVTFGVYDFDAFLKKAEIFYQEGKTSADPRYTVIELPKDRIAIDYDGEIRGIFTRRGKVLAFFRPDFRQLGFVSKAHELEVFRAGAVGIH